MEGARFERWKPASYGVLVNLEWRSTWSLGPAVGALNAAYVAFHDDPGHDCFQDLWAGLSSNVVEVLTRSLQLRGESRAACSTEHLRYALVLSILFLGPVKS